MSFTAADVKALRDETDAPMMECKEALEQANGDLERARVFLREKGKASASKKAGRATKEGRVAICVSDDNKTLGLAVVESETDFVANNEGFADATQRIAAEVLANGTATEVQKTDMAAEIVAKFRENCVVKVAEQIKSESAIAYYVHHNFKSAVIVLSEGENAGSAAVRDVAIHIAWGKPEVINKSDLSQEKLDTEYKIQYERAINEGKSEEIAKNIATGRVNKEYVKEAVLMEQAFFKDPGKSVGQFLAENAKNTKITGFKLIEVGA
jgi:elongation factor Ts